MSAAPRRALTLTVTLEADSVPELRDRLFDLAERVCERADHGRIREQEVLGHQGPSSTMLATLEHDATMTPECFRAEHAAHQQQMFTDRREARRG